MKRSKGFTLVELLVVVGIIALLVTILMPTLQRARELAKQAICSANLNSIGKGLHIYFAEYNDRFPLIREYGDVQDTINNNTQHDDVWDPVLGTNAMQNLWLIIKAGTSERLFHCPTDGEWQDRKSGDLKKNGWVRINNYSYGLHKPYDDEAETFENKAPLTSSLLGAFIIMADKGNGKSVFWTDDEHNKPLIHRDDGFSCLALGGSVTFYKTVVDTTQANSHAGVGGDDIYVAGDEDGEHDFGEPAQTGTDDPIDDTDTFIVPWKK